MATPLSPQVVTYWGYDTALTGIVIDSDTAFISTENALHIVRIDSSAATEELGMTYLSNGTVKSYSSPFLFNCKGYWPGLAVFEMMPDYNFVQGADIGTSARSASVYANDSVLLVGRFNDGGGFYLVNISDIENPVISEHYTENLGSVRDLKLQDDIAFIASSNALKLYQIRGVDGLEYLSQVELGTRLDVLTVADM